MSAYDLIVIGAGPGGYVGAIRAAQLGMSVAIVDKESSLGGTCLNWGCIPSKALLDSSEHYYQAKHQFSRHGITVSDIQLDVAKMMDRKNDVISKTVQGIQYLMEKNKVTVLNGVASFIDETTLSIKSKSGTKKVSAKKILIATGSEVTPLPCAPIDGKQILTSTELLSLTEVPKHLIVIGGGVIGVELGSVYARLGAKVTVIEFLDRLLPTMDRDLGKALERSLKPLGFSTHFNTKVTGVKTTKKKVTVKAETKSGKNITVEGDCVLVSIGRRAYTDGLGLDKVGIMLSDRGTIPVNPSYQTSVPSIYAIGDVIEGPMLAHKASEEAVVCVEQIAGHHSTLNYHTIPGVVYTWPEVAAVGYTESELKDAGRSYKTGKFPFKASGRARASDDTDGFIKVLSDQETDEILGVHMIGPRCADMIAEASLAIEYRASAADIAMLVHPHPTFTEAFKEAAMGASEGQMIHF